MLDSFDSNKILIESLAVLYFLDKVFDNFRNYFI